MQQGEHVQSKQTKIRYFTHYIQVNCIETHSVTICKTNNCIVFRLPPYHRTCSCLSVISATVGREMAPAHNIPYPKLRVRGCPRVSRLLHRNGEKGDDASHLLVDF